MKKGVKVEKRIDKRRKPYEVIGVLKLKPSFKACKSTYACQYGCSHHDVQIREIKEGLRKALKRHKRAVFWVRHPEYNATRLKTDAMSWHIDCGGSTEKVILWSTGPTTMIRWRGGRKVYRPKPFEIVVWDNNEVKHRAPSSSLRQRRWSAVARLP